VVKKQGEIRAHMFSRLRRQVLPLLVAPRGWRDGKSCYTGAGKGL